MHIVSMIALGFSGLLLLVVGFSRLRSPIKTYAKNMDVTLDSNPGLFSELRGIGGVMVLCGIVLLLGIFIDALAFTSSLIAVILFLGFSLGRLVSLRADGAPSMKVLNILAFELVLGVVNIVGVLNGLV